MTDLLNDFESYFVSKALVGTFGFFKDTFLDDPDDAISVFEYAGSVGSFQADPVLRSVQIVVRSTSAKTAKATANNLYTALLVDDCYIDLTTERWGILVLRQTPFKLKVDDQGRSYYCFNVGITTYHD